MIHLVQRQGRTILFSSHILADVERVADRIGILVDGVLRVDCPTDHFKQKVSKLVLEFPGRPPAFPGCAGLVQAWEVGRRLELVIVDFGPDQRRVIESLSPYSWDIVGLNLEDAFVDYTRGPKRALPVFGEETAENHESKSDRGAA
jgi:ABC-2 type transport system ATP-binding protein